MSRIVPWSPAEFGQHVDEAMAIYAEAMGYPPSAATQRGRAARGQVGYDGFAARAALDDDGRLLGFGYGYASLPGQWWHDLVRRAVAAPTADEWLRSAFELSELHVLPACQGAGLGRSLLTSLAQNLPHRTMLLSTPEGDTRAFRLYRHLGFGDLARNHLFPGDSRPFAVLGRTLPFDD